jgi:hypothetical protein
MKLRPGHSCHEFLCHVACHKEGEFHIAAFCVAVDCCEIFTYPVRIH